MQKLKRKIFGAKTQTIKKKLPFVSLFWRENSNNLTNTSNILNTFDGKIQTS